MPADDLKRPEEPAGEDGQETIIEFLADPATHGGAEVEQISTHISRLFLAGERVYKLKRAVRLPYADFSTLERRRVACEAEIEINRRTAPSLYLEAMAVTRSPNGGLALGGEGEAVEWLTVMRRFPQDQLFDRLADRGELTAELAEATAGVVAGMHAAAPVVAAAQSRDIADVAGAIVDEIQRQADMLPADRVSAVADRLEAAAADAAPRLAERAGAGFVRDVHGDLHLGNIVLLDGQPTPFDAIEFDAALRRIDVMYDAAFLVMDLLHRDLAAPANRFLAAYLNARQDDAGLAFLPLFLAMRAAIRAYVTAERARGQAGESGAAAALDDAGVLLDLAATCLSPRPAMLVAVGGLSGTGKTTLARGLAPDIGPLPGAIVLRSDEIRKSLAGVPATARLDERWYRPEVSADVFARMADRARDTLAAGHGVVADGVYGDPEHRRAIADAAAAGGKPFRGLWLQARTDIRAARVDDRRDDASDATAAVARAQRATPPEDSAWTTIDAGGGPEDTLAAARRALAL